MADPRPPRTAFIGPVMPRAIQRAQGHERALARAVATAQARTEREARKAVAARRPAVQPAAETPPKNLP